MKNFLQTRLWVILMAMPIMVHAERISTPHNFQTMVTKSEITVTNSYKTAETALTTYNCSGTNCTFAKDHYSGTLWSFKMLDNGSTVTTTRINELAEFQLAHYPPTKYEDLQVYVSTDGISWGLPLSGDAITYSAGTINVTVPRNNYYVRFRNNASTDVSILSIIWHQDHCNCFIYEAE